MTAATKKLIPAWIIFAIYLILYITNAMTLWPVLSLWALGFAIYLLVKNKFPTKKMIIISVILSLLATVPLLLRQGVLNVGTVIYCVLTFVVTLFSSFAVFSVMEKYGDFELIRRDGKWSPLYSVLIALAVGAVLGAFNIFLGRQNMQMDPGFSVIRIILPLNPGIHEEIANRAVFMAFVIYICRGQKFTKFQSFTMWIMMIVPHVLAHGYDISSSLILCVFFGLPFAILQKKRDLTSAMISHGFVDLIRFIFFGA